MLEILYFAFAWAPIPIVLCTFYLIGTDRYLGRKETDDLGGMLTKPRTRKAGYTLILAAGLIVLCGIASELILYLLTPV